MQLSEARSASDSEEVLVRDEAVQSRRHLPRATAVAVITALLLVTAVAGLRSWGRASDESTGDLTSIQEDEEMEVVPPHDSCSKVKKNCIATKCCQKTGYKCYMHNAGWATCMSKCVPGKDGFCTELKTYKPVATYPGLSFWCMTFYMGDNGNPKENRMTHELSLLRTQLFLGASIFGCPKYAVYSDTDEWLSPGPPEIRTTKVDDVDGDFHMFKRKKQGTWQNAMLFYQAWKDIREKSLFDADYFVKVDPDAIFLPERLLNALMGYKAPAEGIYIENCKEVFYGFFGSLEVVSSTGFKTFLSNLEDCKATLDWKGEKKMKKHGPIGEDVFMQLCMDKHNVSKVSNFTITTDGACKGTIPKALRKQKNIKWKPDCATTKTCGMHPFPKPFDYFSCLAATQAA